MATRMITCGCSCRAWQCSSSVIIRIDQLKDITIDAIHDVYARGHAWLLVKKNAKEATVVRRALAELVVEVVAAGTRDDAPQYEILRLWPSRGP